MKLRSLILSFAVVTAASAEASIHTTTTLSTTVGTVVWLQ